MYSFKIFTFSVRFRDVGCENVVLYLSLGPYLTDVYIRVYTVYMLQSEFGFQINNFSYEAFFVI